MTNWFGFAAFGETWEQSRVRGLIDVAPLPAGEGNTARSVSLNVYWVLAMSAGSRRKELAWSFLRHLASAPMDKLTMLEGAIGVRRSTWMDPQINRIVPYCHKLEMLHLYARELPPHPHLAQISHVIDDLLTQAVSSDAPSAALLSQSQRRVEALIA
jgi:multiple sugar transport system substrate-binding protein